MQRGTAFAAAMPSCKLSSLLCEAFLAAPCRWQFALPYPTAPLASLPHEGAGGYRRKIEEFNFFSLCFYLPGKTLSK